MSRLDLGRNASSPGPSPHLQHSGESAPIRTSWNTRRDDARPRRCDLRARHRYLGAITGRPRHEMYPMVAPEASLAMSSTALEAADD